MPAYPAAAHVYGGAEQSPDRRPGAADQRLIPYQDHVGQAPNDTEPGVRHDRRLQRRTVVRLLRGQDRRLSDLLAEQLPLHQRAVRQPHVRSPLPEPRSRTFLRPRSADLARARVRNDEDPAAFMQAAINLADQMVDFALIHATALGAQTKLRPEEIQAIRDNGKSQRRLDHGDLVGRPQFYKIFPWFPLCVALRRNRPAHPSRTGSTRPHALRSDDLIAAKALLVDITESWIEDMHRASW